MIIKLTEMRKDGPYPTYVNMDHVQYFSKSVNGNDTRLKISGDNLYLFVKESVEEIMNLMAPPMMNMPNDIPKDAWDALAQHGNITYGAR